MIERNSTPEYLREQTYRLCQNLTRVDSLLDLHQCGCDLLKHHQANLLPEDEGKPLPEVDDVLRAATVLLHASLEDFLKRIADKYLPADANKRRTYNGCEHIKCLLEQLGINAYTCNSQFSLLGGMMMRRHKIAHNADCPDGSAVPEPITADIVQRWRIAVQLFMEEMLLMVHYVQEERSGGRQRGNGDTALCGS